MSGYGTKWMEGSTEACRSYTHSGAEPLTVMAEFVEPEPITYEFGTISTILTGFAAWLYRGMVWMYGEDEAKARLFSYGLVELPKPEPKKERRRYPARKHRRNAQMSN